MDKKLKSKIQLTHRMLCPLTHPCWKEKKEMMRKKG
jgi:hypothetical protein